MESLPIPSGLVTLVAFVVMLGLLVLVHELGHFLVAIWLGIRVEEFGLGYPPRALTLFERNGVKYTLNWLPIGGFVRFGGEDETLYGVGSLSTASPWKKMAVLFAGPLMNLLLAWLILSAVFMARGAPAAGAAIGTVQPNTPAATAGFQAGDVIVEMGGQPIGRNYRQVSQFARSNPGEPLAVVVRRGGEDVRLTVIPGPWTDQKTGKHYDVGFGFGYGPNPAIEPVGLPAALGIGFASTWQVLGDFISGLGQFIGSWFGLAQAPPGGVGGPIMIARGTGEIIQQSGLTGFWQWTALISLNLFLINLLPIPALDGSHILFSLIELARRGKKIPPEKEAMVHAVGFMMLMGLMVIITVSDLANWIGGAPVLGGR